VNAQRDPYGAYISDYTWGSNAVKALAGGMFADEALYALGTHSAAEAMNAAVDTTPFRYFSKASTETECGGSSRTILPFDAVAVRR
jgi:hypothetical protein